MTFKRWIDPKYFDRVLDDCGFLFQRLQDSCGEFDLRIRNNYFNVYYRGNNLAKVDVMRNGYKISIHKEFADPVIDSTKFPSTFSNTYREYRADGKTLRQLLSRKVMESLASKIKKRNFSEELVLEQMILTDNWDSSELLLLDRQVTGGALGQKQMDLLALAPVDGDQCRCRFLVLEIKLGNNPELAGPVGNQVMNYQRALDSGFAEYRETYEKQFLQLKAMGFFRHWKADRIMIEKPVGACIIVGGYSGFARAKLKQLQSQHPTVKVGQYSHRWPPKWHR